MGILVALAHVQVGDRHGHREGLHAIEDVDDLREVQPGEFEVDGVLLIVGPSISKALVRELCSRLAHVRARILGVIMNEAEMPVGAFPSS